MTIRLRLTLLFVLLLAAVGLAQSVVVFGGFSHTLWSVAVTDVHNKGQQVQDYLRDLESERARAGRALSLSSFDALPRAFSDDGMYIQLTGQDGAVLNKSPNLGSQRLPAPHHAGVEVVDLPLPHLFESPRVMLMSRPLTLGGQPPIAWVQVAYSLQANQRALRQLATLEVAGWTLSIVVAFAAGLFFAGRALRPVASMTAKVQEMQSTDLHRRLETGPPPRDELGQLAATFNDLFDRLEIAFESQQRFVADASHELKSPLTTIRGNLQLLQRRGGDNPEEAKRWTETALKEVDRLTRLVQELLELAKVGEGKMVLSTQPVDLSAVAKDVAHQYEVIAPRVHFEGDGPVMVLGEADRLRQVLINLVDNAVRATREQGEVTVAAVSEGARVKLIVADTGVGIPKDRLALIFDRFYRVDAARDRSLGGTGLGLSITAAIVQAHQGAIEVASEEGRGTTFTITFPALKSQPALTS